MKMARITGCMCKKGRVKRKAKSYVLETLVRTSFQKWRNNISAETKVV